MADWDQHDIQCHKLKNPIDPTKDIYRASSQLGKIDKPKSKTKPQIKGGKGEFGLRAVPNISRDIHPITFRGSESAWKYIVQIEAQGITGGQQKQEAVGNPNLTPVNWPKSCPCPCRIKCKSRYRAFTGPAVRRYQNRIRPKEIYVSGKLNGNPQIQTMIVFKIIHLSLCR